MSKKKKRTTWTAFQPILLSMLKQVAKKKGLNKKERARFLANRSEIRRVVDMFVKNGNSLGVATSLDELLWVEDRRPVIFIESAQLVQHIWNLRVDVDPDVLDQFEMRSFAIAAPLGSTIGGHPMGPYLVSKQNFHERSEAWMNFVLDTQDVGSRPPILLDKDPQATGEERVLHVLRNDIRTYEMQRVTIPPVYLRDSLLNPDSMQNTLGTYKDGDTRSTFDLSAEENDYMWAAARFAVNLMVYCIAAPHRLVEGLPNRFSLTEGMIDQHNTRPMFLDAPPAPQGGGTHASPTEHWRNYHIRRYPRRKDGTRRLGFIEIDGTLVCGDRDLRTTVADKER